MNDTNVFFFFFWLESFRRPKTGGKSLLTLGHFVSSTQNGRHFFFISHPHSVDTEHVQRVEKYKENAEIMSSKFYFCSHF